MRGAECASGKNSSPPMQTLQRRRCQTRTRSRKKACVYGVRVSRATIFAYVEGNPLGAIDPEGLMGLPRNPLDLIPLEGGPGGGGGTVGGPSPFGGGRSGGGGATSGSGASGMSGARPVPIPITPPMQCERDDRCEKQRRQDEALCIAIAGARYGARGKAVCLSSAMERYAQCLADKPRPPLHGVDTPL
ncbi:hypothetical protein C8D04_1571 [Simplicispira sp. 125]|nr:hypothetical protein C8D04_1571 [Simplicispira sp. 125]REG17262.1 hypothetical protein C8D01_1881 [Simplicispira sp. 110]